MPTSTTSSYLSAANISILIAAIAAIASAWSAYYSKRSAEISKSAFEYSQTPHLALEYHMPYLVLRNIGLGTARFIEWSGDENMNITAPPERCRANILLPQSGALTTHEIVQEGAESVAIRIAFSIPMNNTTGVVTIRYKNPSGKDLTTKISVTRNADGRYEMREIA